MYIWVCEKEVSKPNHSTDLQALPPPLPKTINNYTFALNKSKLTAADTDLRVGKSILCMIALEVTCVRGERGGGWGGGGLTLEHSPVKRWVTSGCPVAGSSVTLAAASASVSEPPSSSLSPETSATTIHI